MADETTWTEVCSNVGFQDGLYQTCREKIEGFTGFQGGAYDELEEVDDIDFGAALAQSATSVPDVPGADSKPEGSGELPIQKILMFGGVAALVWVLLMRKKRQEVITTTESTTPDTTAVASPFAA